MTEEIKDELMALVDGNLVKAEPSEGIEMTEWVFANETNTGLRQLFHTFMQGAFSNRIGLAHCKNAKTGALETLIVGVDPNEGGGAKLFPLAKVLTEADHSTEWLSPDGRGGYLGDTNS